MSSITACLGHSLCLHWADQSLLHRRCLSSQLLTPQACHASAAATCTQAGQLKGPIPCKFSAIQCYHEPDTGVPALIYLRCHPVHVIVSSRGRAEAESRRAAGEIVLSARLLTPLPASLRPARTRRCQLSSRPSCCGGCSRSTPAPHRHAWGVPSSEIPLHLEGQFHMPSPPLSSAHCCSNPPRHLSIAWGQHPELIWQGPGPRAPGCPCTAMMALLPCRYVAHGMAWHTWSAVPCGC